MSGPPTLSNLYLGPPWSWQAAASFSKRYPVKTIISILTKLSIIVRWRTCRHHVRVESRRHHGHLYLYRSLTLPISTQFLVRYLVYPEAFSKQNVIKRRVSNVCTCSLREHIIKRNSQLKLIKEPTNVGHNDKLVITLLSSFTKSFVSLFLHLIFTIAMIVFLVFFFGKNLHQYYRIDCNPQVRQIPYLWFPNIDLVIDLFCDSP